MTAKQQKRRQERRRIHNSRGPKAADAGHPAGVPPQRRKRTLTKKVVRAMGRKLRPERYS